MNTLNTYTRRGMQILFSFIFLFTLPVSPTNAQEVEKGFQPIIQSDNSVEVGKNIIFRSDVSTIPIGAEVRSYLWEFGNGQFSSQEEVAHIFQDSGSYNVKLKVTWAPEAGTISEVSELTKEIFVYERALFLITDLFLSEERINSLRQRAEDQGVYLHLIQAETNFRFNTNLVKLIEQSLGQIQTSSSVIIWSDSAELLSLLNNFSGRINLSDKEIVLLSEGNISLLRNILLGSYNVLQPQRIIITRREALDEFFTTKEGDVLEVIRNRGYDFDVIDATIANEFNLFSLPSYGMSYLQEKGVEDSVILLILFLPVVVTVVTFLRLVIGLSTVGARLPIVFTYTFLVLGWWWGAFVVVVLAFISSFFRFFLFRSHLLYTAKVGILTSFLGLILLLLLGIMLYFGGGHFDFSSALIMVILAAMIDRVGGVEGERGWWALIRIFIESLFISSLGFLLISWEWLQVLLLAHPEVIILFILANVFMGRFTGLRLMEYFRFREVLKYTEEE
jgi:hypothetical protein